MSVCTFRNKLSICVTRHVDCTSPHSHSSSSTPPKNNLPSLCIMALRIKKQSTCQIGIASTNATTPTSTPPCALSSIERKQKLFGKKPVVGSFSFLIAANLRSTLAPLLRLCPSSRGLSRCAPARRAPRRLRRVEPTIARSRPRPGPRQCATVSVAASPVATPCSQRSPHSRAQEGAPAPGAVWLRRAAACSAVPLSSEYSSSASFSRANVDAQRKQQRNGVDRVRERRTHHQRRAMSAVCCTRYLVSPGYACGNSNGATSAHHTSTRPLIAATSHAVSPAALRTAASAATALPRHRSARATRRTTREQYRLRHSMPHCAAPFADWRNASVAAQTDRACRRETCLAFARQSIQPLQLRAQVPARATASHSMDPMRQPPRQNCVGIRCSRRRQIVRCCDSLQRPNCKRFGMHTDSRQCIGRTAAGRGGGFGASSAARERSSKNETNSLERSLRRRNEPLASQRRAPRSHNFAQLARSAVKLGKVAPIALEARVEQRRASFRIHHRAVTAVPNFFTSASIISTRGGIERGNVQQIADRRRPAASRRAREKYRRDDSVELPWSTANHRVDQQRQRRRRREPAPHIVSLKCASFRSDGRDTALCKGVAPCEFRALASAPRARSSRTSSVCSRCDASCSAVLPELADDTLTLGAFAAFSVMRMVSRSPR
jgi:hypothetical protein